MKERRARASSSDTRGSGREVPAVMVGESLPQDSARIKAPAPETLYRRGRRAAAAAWLMLARAEYWEAGRRAWRGSKSPRRCGSPAAMTESTAGYCLWIREPNFEQYAHLEDPCKEFRSGSWREFLRCGAGHTAAWRFRAAPCA